MRFNVAAKSALAAIALTIAAGSVSVPAHAYDPRAMTGPGFLALASGRTISGWLTKGNRVFYLKVEKGSLYSMRVPAQNGFPELHETGKIRPTRDHYCLTPFGNAGERCLRVRSLDNNEFESTDDKGNRIARWWLAAQQ